MGDLDALLTRLRAAAGADRELDAEIDLLLSLPCITERGGVALVSDGGVHEWYGEGPPAQKRNPAMGAWRRPRMAYTSSVDAALTLVPEGWAWAKRLDGAFYVAPIDEGSPYSGQRGDAPTPALALCIAALEARRAGGAA
jgi:hypothetical protein